MAPLRGWSVLAPSGALHLQANSSLLIYSLVFAVGADALRQANPVNDRGWLLCLKWQGHELASFRDLPVCSQSQTSTSPVPKPASDCGCGVGCVDGGRGSGGATGSSGGGGTDRGDQFPGFER